MKEKRRNNRVKKAVLKIHMILGLVTGLVVFIVAITGCCWVFNAEISSLSEEKITFDPMDGPGIKHRAILERAKKMLPATKIHGIIYKQPTEPVEVVYYQPEPEAYYSVFLHPITGEMLRVKDNFAGFFPFILKGHLYLWLPKAVGKQVVSWSTLIFLIMLITGIVLWWPKKKKVRKQRFWFRWKPGTGWKRKNFDLHSITGFYASVLALVLAITGLVMAFGWFGFLYYKAIGGAKEYRFEIPSNVSENASSPDPTKTDELPTKLRHDFPAAESFEIHIPRTDTHSVYVEVSYDESVYYSNDFRFYDQHTLEELSTKTVFGKYSDTDASDALMRMTYDIHIGAIGGIWGKILAFVISLLCASLPVTGFLMWKGRRYKNQSVKNVE